nr:conjugal transfer protein TrbH [uncultured bacterium]
MRKIAFVAVLALALTGCATTSPYGNYLQSATVDQQKLAGEAVKQLATLWPPAKTRFELQQATPDAFGAGLVKELRESGYALLEFNPEAAKAKASASTEAAPAVEAPASATKALPLRYVLDQAGTSNLYRLTLTVGNQSITRPYLEQDGALVPAGYWVRKE